LRVSENPKPFFLCATVTPSYTQKKCPNRAPPFPFCNSLFKDCDFVRFLSCSPWAKYTPHVGSLASCPPLGLPFFLISKDFELNVSPPFAFLPFPSLSFAPASPALSPPILSGPNVTRFPWFLRFSNRHSVFGSWPPKYADIPPPDGASSPPYFFFYWNCRPSIFFSPFRTLGFMIISTLFTPSSRVFPSSRDNPGCFFFNAGLFLNLPHLSKFQV